MPILGIYASSVQNSIANASAFESIATANGNGSSSSVTFSSIPQTYTHLQIRYMAKTTRAYYQEALYVRINGTSSANYATHYLYGDTGTVYSGASTATTIIFAPSMTGASNTSIFGSGVVDVLDYTSTNKYKTVRAIGGYDDNGSAGPNPITGLYSGFLTNDLTAVTSITLVGNGALDSNSTFALYGIKG
jgi:hypothetical protein